VKTTAVPGNIYIEVRDRYTVAVMMRYSSQGPVTMLCCPPLQRELEDNGVYVLNVGPPYAESGRFHYPPPHIV
jgi:hypothetical protein